MFACFEKKNVQKSELDQLPAPSVARSRRCRVKYILYKIRYFFQKSIFSKFQNEVNKEFNENYQGNGLTIILNAFNSGFHKNNRFLTSLLKIPGFINMYGTLQKDIFLTKSKRQKIDYDFIKLKNFNNKVFYILFLFFKLKTY